LAAFTTAEVKDPTVAATSLLGLGQILAEVDQTREACLVFRQLMSAYKGSIAAEAGAPLLAKLDCP
ncbi:MAG: hypothetical protein AAGF71_15360, partial [Pseudomonadota bacterium]